jgi:hypothetical protein
LKTPSQRTLLAAILRNRTSEGTANSAVLPDHPLTEFEQSCANQYAQDPWFSDPVNIGTLTQHRDLFFHGTRLAVPDGSGLRKVCFAHAHSSAYAGHPGYLKTLKLLERTYYWPKMISSVQKWVKECPSCQRNKSTNQKPGGLLQPLPIPPAPWSSVSMDLIVSLPLTSAGHTAIVVFVDRFSKMAHFVATTDQVSAKDFALLFRHHVLRLHGCPRDLVSDRDPRFTSHFFRELCALMGVQQNMSTAFHPQSDGQTERVNRVLEDMLRHFVGPLQDDWDTYLDSLEFAYNNSCHESLGTSPFKLLYGHNPKTPYEAISLSQNLPASQVPAAAKFSSDYELSLAQAKSCLLAAQSRQRAYANTKRRDVSFSEGEEVLLSTRNLKLKVVAANARKLLPKFIGPFTVVKRVYAVAYKLGLPETMKVHDVFHVSLLKHYTKSGSYQPPAPTLFEDEHLENTVEVILDHKDTPFRGKTRRHYLVQWQGYGPEHNTFEPEENCTNCAELISEYWQYRSRTHKIANSSGQAPVGQLLNKARRKRKKT